MTSTQEPNTMAPQSALCIYWKMESKTDRSNIYWDLNVQVLFPNHFFFVTGVRVKFRFERLRKKLRSITVDNCEVWTYCLELWEQFAIFQATTRKTSLRTSCLHIRNWKLDTKWRTSQPKSRKENSGLLWMVNSTPTWKHKFPTRVYSSFAVVDSENVLHFVKVWLFYYIQFVCCFF